VKFAAVLALPNITHDAAAVALCMDVEQEDGKVGDGGRRVD
jgi:hypothetical protein